MRRGLVMVLASSAVLACGDDAVDDGEVDASREVVAGEVDAGDISDGVDATDGIEETAAPEVVADPWRLADGLYRLAGLDPMLPGDDLDNLWSLIGDGEIYGLGESVHTSGGFYAAKERIIRYLVAERGLRVFGMETPRSAARELDAFIQGGTCDIDPVAVFGAPDYPIFGVFVDDHTAALFRWLCEWNAAHDDDRVRFFGFDAQQPLDDLSELEAFLRAHSEATADAALSTLAPCNSDYEVPYPEAEFVACTAAVDALEADLVARIQPAIDAHAWAELAMALRSFRSWQGQAYYNAIATRPSWESRDVAMADLFEARMALDFAGQRAIVWAHNYHLAADHEAIADTNFVAYAKTFGSELRARRGAAYRAVAITAYRPGINWPGVSDPSGETSMGMGANAIEQGFYEALEEAWILYDTRSDWAPGDALWRLSEEEMIMRDNFDAIVFLRESPPMEALLW